MRLRERATCRRLRVTGLAVVAVAVMPVLIGAPARHAAHSPVGSWHDTYTVVTKGPLKGGRYANPTVITSYTASTGKFVGVDAGLPVAGTLKGHKWTMVVGGSGGYTADVHGTMTFKHNGAATWKGHWHDSNGNSGTWYGTRPAKHKKKPHTALA